MSKYRAGIALTVIALMFCVARTIASADHSIAGPYIDPKQMTSVPFPMHSHWLQPWRAYQETVPAQRFLDAQGINLDSGADVNYNLICEMLARHGIRHARLEVGWGSVNWEDESRLNDVTDLKKRLLACKKNGIRPLILLNGNSGAPCPYRSFDGVLAADAHKGDRTVELTDASAIKVGYSGFSNLSDYRAAEAIVTATDGTKVTLSKPLPKDLGLKGARVPMATLKYRPFGPPDSAEYRSTAGGWKRYTETAARTVAEILGTSGKPDLGFDMEIWNELSFGSSFLTINAYYDPRIAEYDEFGTWSRLVKTTIEEAEAHPLLYRGVRFVDGLRNTIPWPAASTEPTRVSAMSAHPYAGRKQFPADDYRTARVDATGAPDKSAFVPAYIANFPEYYGTMLQPESVLRDMGPIPSPVQNAVHGRDSRIVNGRPLPCPLWFTEIGFGPDENGITGVPEALAMKAKTTDRYECLFINKGLERIYFFSALSGDKGLGVVQENFTGYTRTHTAYPADDTPYTSPMLRTIGRLTAKMREGVDPSLAKTRPIVVESVSDRHNGRQFDGDGTPAHPPLYNRDVLAILPFQVNAHRFIIPYYVMTRDVTKTLAPEDYNVRLGGLHTAHLTLTAYDPMEGLATPVKPRDLKGDHATLTLRARDYPILLIAEEGLKGR